MLVNLRIVFRHAEDAGFLWAYRRRLIRTNQLSHAERTRLDMRLDGHLDGLLISGEAGWKACVDLMGSAPQAGPLFAATALAVAMDRRDRVERILTRGAGNPSAIPAMASALGWRDFDCVFPNLESWLASSDVYLQTLALRGFGVHRRRPTTSLGPYLAQSEGLVQRAAVKLAGEVGAVEHAPAMRGLLAVADEQARFESARALAHFGDDSPAVRDALLASCRVQGETGVKAARALVVLAPRDGSALFRCFAAEPHGRRLAAVVEADPQ